jgi:hypothetical protein
MRDIQSISCSVTIVLTGYFQVDFDKLWLQCVLLLLSKEGFWKVAIWNIVSVVYQKIVFVKSFLHDVEKKQHDKLQSCDF